MITEALELAKELVKLARTALKPSPGPKVDPLPPKQTKPIRRP